MTRTMRTRTPRAALVAIASTIPMLAALGQPPRPLAQPDAVPFALAQVLITAGGFSADPQLQVGSAPGWINDRIYMPKGARLLGSAFLGGTVVAVLSVPLAGDSLVAERVSAPFCGRVEPVRRHLRSRW